MALILLNAFRSLGLPATATPRETRRVIEEFAVLSSLGRGTAIDPETLSQIRQTLEDPVERLRAELYWLHSPAHIVDPKIDLANEVDVGATVIRLQAVAGRGVTREQAIALHDLAVLRYAHDIENGLSTDESAALAGWADVWASDEFWAYMSERAHEADDPRVTESVLEGLRQDLPATILEHVADRASSFVDRRDEPRASVAVRAIRRCGMPERDVDVATRKAVSPLRAVVEAGIEELNLIRGKLTASEGSSPANRAAFRSAQAVLTSEVLAPYERLRKVDPLCDPALGDKVAAEIRGLGVSAYNVLEDWDSAYLLARVALSLGRTSEALTGLARDQATAACTYHQSMAHKATGLRRYAQAAAHLELAADYAQDDDDRRHLSNIARGASARLRSDAVVSAKTSISEALDHQVEAFRNEIEPGSVSTHDGTPTEAAKSVRRRSPQPTRRGVAIAIAAAVAVGLGGLYMVARVDGSGASGTRATPAEESSDASSATSNPEEVSLGDQRLREAAATVNDAFSTGNPVALGRAADMIVAVHAEFGGQPLGNRAAAAAKALRIKIDRHAALRPCASADFVNFLPETPLFKTWARERLPSVLLGCAAQHLAARRYAQATTFYHRVLDASPNERLAANARQALVAAEKGLVKAKLAAEKGVIKAQVAQIRSEGTSALDTPNPVGSTWRTGAELTIANASPYPLELLLSGPDAQRITIPRCTSCKKYSYGSSPGTCSTVPRRTITVAAGTYSVILRWLKGARVIPGAGKWTLSEGQRYEAGCFYVVGAP